MSRIVKVLLPLMVVATVFSCQHGSNSKSTVIVDSTVTDTFFIPDTLSEVDEEIEEADESDRLDASFDDFMFAFTHSDRLQSKRIVWPLAYIDAEGKTRKLTSLNCASEFRFLEEDFYTVLYGDRKQIENQKLESEDSLIIVERINLEEEDIRSYEFNPLKVMVLDPDEDDAYIEGTINAEQWRSFCPDVPQGIISNIRYGVQKYNSRQMILQKSGSSNGLQELFFFTKVDNEWYLKRYEN